jgi:hypothetical protein
MKTRIALVCSAWILCVSLFACNKQVLMLKEEPAATTNASVMIKSNLANNLITFSGYIWIVRTSNGGLQGPGPNYWNPNNGYLHVKIAKDSLSNVWSCAEITSSQSFGFGTFQWTVEGNLTAFDKNVILGLFNYSGNDGHDEQDIEVGRFGSANNPLLNYTVYPDAQHGPSYATWGTNFTTAGTYSTHRFTRTANSVVFKSMHGFYDDDTNLFATHTYTTPGTSISQLSMPIHINLWTKNGAPSDAKEVEIIIHSFKFTAL